jgi:hypothetical protein
MVKGLILRRVSREFEEREITNPRPEGNANACEGLKVCRVGSLSPR